MPEAPPRYFADALVQKETPNKDSSHILLNR